MNRFLSPITLFLLFLAPAFSFCQDGDYQPGKLFLKVRPESGIVLPQTIKGEIFPLDGFPELNALAKTFGIHSLFKPFKTPDPRLQCIYEMHFSEFGKITELIFSLQRFSWVEYAERVPLMKMDFTPNDLNFLQWNLTKIDAQHAWDISEGSTEIVIAIVDNAIRYTHEDLAANVWVNPGEIPNNNIDDDGNGFIDDINGYDVADHDNDPMPPAGGGFDHGSHTAGIASAVTNNGKGISSIGFKTKLMCVKTKRDSSSGASLDNTYDGIDYAIASGADVVSMSFGGMGYSGTDATLFAVGHDSGVVFVASAGNDNLYVQRFPAAYPHVISVGSTDFDDTKSSFSNYHPSVDVMAPGNGIYSCLGSGNSNYGFMGGTSMSAPLAAGLCALILSVNDTLNPDGVETCLKFGCDNINAVNPSYIGAMGAGRINAKNSLDCALNPSTSISSIVAPIVFIPPFPNPGINQINLSAVFPAGMKVELNISNELGQVIEKIFSGISNGSRIDLHWDCSALPAGIYFAQWKTNEAIKMQGLSVEK